MSSNTLKYTPTKHDRKFNTFIEEYFSGPDTTIVCDDERIDNISHIEFSLQEQLKPIYSYNSYIWDDVAIGNRIVIGSLTVPLINNKENDDINNNVAYNYSEETDNQSEQDTKPGWTNNGEQSAYNTENNTNSVTKENSNTTTSNAYDKDLKKVQEILQEIGYDVDITGIYDVKTQNAISRYCEINEIEENTINYSESIRNLIINNYNAKCIAIESDVYIAPSTNTRSLYKIKQNNNVIVLATFNNFYYIKIKGENQKGYIPKNKIKVGDENE